MEVMSRRARRQANARPWEHPEALALGPEDEDDEPQTDDWDGWLPEVEQEQERPKLRAKNLHR